MNRHKAEGNRGSVVLGFVGSVCCIGFICFNRFAGPILNESN